MVDRLQSGFGVEGDCDPGEVFEMREPVGVEREAEVGEGLKRRGIFGIVRGEHAGGSGGSLGEGDAGLKDSDAHSAAIEFEGEREADDAGAGDADVRVLHKKILDACE
jgi:hypothetical protein